MEPFSTYRRTTKRLSERSDILFRTMEIKNVILDKQFVYKIDPSKLPMLKFDLQSATCQTSPSTRYVLV